MSEGELKKYIKYAQYSIFKARIKAILEDLRTSDHQKAPREDNKNNALILEFPRADKLSNGQRDVIQLVAYLEKAKLELDKSKNLLIIDELFDYLDDANLLIVQYFLSRLVKDFEKQDKDLYVVLLTHLDPSYFKSYNLKFNISALNSQDYSTKKINQHFVKLLIHREDKVPNNEAYKESLESNFLHYHNNPVDIDRQIVPCGLSKNNHLLSFFAFSKHLNSEFDKYMTGGSYCCYSVSCYIRIEIEKRMYTELKDEFKDTFLKTHKTLEKLELCEEKDIKVPELFFLLGIIHNQALHIKDEQIADLKSFMIYPKLENAIIKEWLRKEFFKEVGTLLGNPLPQEASGFAGF